MLVCCLETDSAIHVPLTGNAAVNVLSTIMFQAFMEADKMKLLLLQMLGRNVVLVLKLAKSMVTENNGRQVIANWVLYLCIVISRGFPGAYSAT